MCYNCGCNLPNDDMGNKDNITNQTLTHLGEHWGKNLKETQQMVFETLQKELNGEKVDEDAHLKEMFETAARTWGQSVDEAKRNAFELLKIELKA